MTRPLNIGIAGCGGISPSHIDIYSMFPEDARVVAVCDLLLERARSRVLTVQERYQARARMFREEAAQAEGGERERLEWKAILCDEASSQEVGVFTEVQEMVEGDQVDAISVCVPPFAHAAPAVAALEAGKHVFCEGPIAGSLREADAMLAAMQKSGAKLTIQFGTRLSRGPLMSKRAIESGYLGKILFGKVDVLWYREQSYYDSDLWRGTWMGECGGATFHHGRYAIDCYLWLMGKVQTVYAQMDTFTHRIEVEDCSVASLRFEDGALGQITASTSAQPNPAIPSQRIEIFGEKASMLVLPDFHFGSADNAYADQTRASLDREVPAPPYSGMIVQMKDFLDAILEDRLPVVLPETVRPQLEVTRAIYKSVATSLPTSLPIRPYDPYYG